VQLRRLFRVLSGALSVTVILPALWKIESGNTSDAPFMSVKLPRRPTIAVTFT